MDDLVNALHARGPVLFVAVATAQNAANLPPIIEMAEPGDKVLWLESARAHAQGWADGARVVLDQRQVQSVTSVAIPDEPAGVEERVSVALGAFAGMHPAFVYNGGTKLTTLSIAHAVRSIDHAALYGQDQPAELWFLPNGVGGPLVRRPYVRRPLRLEEILTCRGYKVWNPGAARQIWPAACDLGSASYGVEVEATAAAHDASKERDRASRARERGYATYDDLLATKSGDLAAWVADMAVQIDAVRGNEPPAMRWKKAVQRHRGRLSGVFNRACRLIAVSKGLSPPPDMRLGDLFELAAARRLRAWLTANGRDYRVVETWHGVKVGVPGTAGHAAEWDLTLVYLG